MQIDPASLMQMQVPDAKAQENQDQGQQERSNIVRRVPGAKMSIPIVIGSIAQRLKKGITVPGEDWELSYKWGCYVRGLRETSSPSDPMEEQDLSFMIKKVEFQIHESFPESLITIDKHPFEIHNAGYGEFPITITIYFQDPHERPLEYTHQLKFEAD